MASLRNFSNLFRSSMKAGNRRCFSQGRAFTGAAASVRPLLIGGLSLAAGALAYQNMPKKADLFPSLAAASPSSQPSVFSGTKQHALYLWIHLRPGASPKACAKVAASLQSHVDRVCPPDMRDEDDEVIAGVGFGPHFFTQVSGKTAKKNYTMPERKGTQGPMPSSGGDIFVHAKSNDRSKLFELAWSLMRALPKDSVESYEDIYGWVYQGGRDLSGFIDGTENAADEESRQKIAVEPATGGSYVITQKWLHDLPMIAESKDNALEGMVGRSRADSTELRRKAITSHVARMTGGNNFEQPKPFEIVRQSQPFGGLSGEHGLFFIGYAASPENHEYMLARMCGGGGDGHSDDIMRFSRCVKGTYWYFPGVEELRKLA